MAFQFKLSRFPLRPAKARGAVTNCISPLDEPLSRLISPSFHIDQPHKHPTYHGLFKVSVSCSSYFITPCKYLNFGEKCSILVAVPALSFTILPTASPTGRRLLCWGGVRAKLRLWSFLPSLPLSLLAPRLDYSPPLPPPLLYRGAPWKSVENCLEQKRAVWQFLSSLISINL